MKVIALYLPQFHTVPENEQWWGKGFTDWVSTKNAKPLYDGHYQPHIPLNNNYYDLLEKKTMEWQAELLHKYDVDGFCFYHYYFGNDKKILEKPAENLLHWNDIDMPFCFCWANVSWVRSWAVMKDTDHWMNDRGIVDSGKSVLIEQIYGTQAEWREHFDYLFGFFKDRRYIKLDGKPIIWIYRADLIPCLSEMVDYWRQCAEEYGLPGIYVLGSHFKTRMLNVLDAAVIYEPGEVLPKVKYKRDSNSLLRLYDYDEYWDKSIMTDYPDGIKTYYTGLVNYDDTPRQGEDGHVLNGTPEKFEKKLCDLLKKSFLKGNELLFINAWNEWGEGNHLEPDEKNGYGYLEAVSKAKQTYQCSEVDFDLLNAESVSIEEMALKEKYNDEIDKRQTNLEVLNLWIEIKQNGIQLYEHPIFENTKRIGIYGYGILGRLLAKEFKGTDIVIEYVIDKSKKSIDGLKLIDTENEFPQVDLIIISLPNYYQEIVEILNNKRIHNYIRIDEIIRELRRTKGDA